MSDKNLQDPQEKHSQPETSGEQLAPPGSDDSVTAAMGDKPDHGESSYQGTGKLSERVAVITHGATVGSNQQVAGCVLYHLVKLVAWQAIINGEMF